MRRIMTLAVVALVMAAMMVATALPVFAQGKGPGPCIPPGEVVRGAAKFPGSVPGAFDVGPGRVISEACAPGHQL
jgi:hypothetical protein